MKKLISTIAATLTAAILTIPAMADLLPIPGPDPVPDDVISPLPDIPPIPAPEPQQASMLIPVLAVAVVVIAAAVLARTIIRKRKTQ